ncbi:hypothetical protein QVD17_27328 [Tagetes erecta]|uniref:AP2/ERF domain-containing protein n=1 Tax=Tagetes erecta TaxID=13708 RepID=A0AAD8NRK2_TARER|nr:hypothetical protein QVD17_27328 [Tagetes erecta]
MEADGTKYRGVRKRKWGKWVSEIRLPKSRERIWLGSYDSPEKAARAFDAALFCLRGNTAKFNFPHQPPNIPGGTDLPPSQIQAVAANFANSYSSSRDDLQGSHTSTSMDNNVVVSSPSMDVVGDHITTIQDFGIFPGFDDYFMPLHTLDYEEEVVYDEVYSNDSSFLWNF